MLSAEAYLSWLHLLQTQKTLLDEFDTSLAGSPVSIVEYELLWRLATGKDRRVSMQDLSRVMLLTRSGITRLVIRVENAGLVRREVLASDRRFVYAVLTDDGFDALLKCSVNFDRVLRDCFISLLTADELHEFDRLMRKVIEGNGRVPEIPEHAAATSADCEF